MRRNSQFVLRQVAGRNLVIPVGEAAESFSGMITLNESGKFLWELLETEQTEESLANAMMEAYGFSEERALNGARKFVESIYSTGAIIK